MGISISLPYRVNVATFVNSHEVLDGGPLLADGSVKLRQAVGVAESTRLQPGKTGGGCDADVDLATLPRRGKVELQDGGFRRVGCPGQPVDGSLVRQTLRLAKSCHPLTPLWDFDYREYAQVFQEVAARLGVEATPYQTRHSGPSIDRSRDSRSLVEVQKRGQWRAHKSVTRYEKSARLAKTWEGLNPHFKAHAEWCEQNLGGILLGHVAARSFVATET